MLEAHDSRFFKARNAFYYVFMQDMYLWHNGPQFLLAPLTAFIIQILIIIISFWYWSQRISVCVRVSVYALVYWSSVLIVAFELICTEMQLKVRITRPLIIIAV